jgi:hypothetical protein
MYIDRIDEYIDKIIDSFYNEVWNNNKLKIKEGKFYIYAKDINRLILEYVNNLKEKDIDVIKSEYKNFLKETIIRYLCFYVYLSIYYLINDEDIFIKEIILISKNDNKNIKNFYNSVNNSILIKLGQFLRNILVLVNINDSDKVYKIVKDDPIKYESVIIFLNDIGNEYIQKLFSNKNPNRIHNIIKSIIYKEIYINQEKKDFLLYLENKNNEKVEYKYISIVVPKIEYIDYSSIENILIKTYPNNIIEEVYKMFVEYEEYIVMPINSDYKINQLFNKGILVPIVEDFLRYHRKDAIISVDKINDNERTTKKDNTKIKYIVSKMNEIIDYYSITDEKKKKDIEKYFYSQMKDRQVILYDELEEEKIIEKLLLQNVIENNIDYEDLIEYRSYSYINFRDIKGDGFTFKPNNTIIALRKINFENKASKMSSLQYRIGNKHIGLNIIGVVLPNNTSIPCLTLNNIKKSEGFLDILNILKNNMDNNLFGKNSNSAKYWFFDTKKDKLEIYKNITSDDKEEYCKTLLEQIYDNILDLELNNITKYIKSKKSIYLYELRKIINIFENKLFQLPNYNKDVYKMYIELYKYIILGDDTYDINENLKTGKKIELPILKIDEIKDSRLIIKKKEDIIVEVNNIYDNALCVHNYEWIEMSMIRYKNPTKFNQMFFEFYKKYSILSNDNNFVCKSCGSELDIKKYVTEYQAGGTSEDITMTLTIESELENLPEYEKLIRAIKNIDKIISKISSITNINYYVGSESVIKMRRQNITKQVIDIIIIMNELLKGEMNNRKKGEGLGKQYGIITEISYMFGFELDNDIFVYSSQEIDKFKLRKYDNVLAYIIFSIIYELNPTDLVNMFDMKVCNIILFEKYGINLFDKILIKIDNSTNLSYIKDYKLLCYVIFYITCMMSRYGMWMYIGKDDIVFDKKTLFNPLIQKIMIHTVLDIINMILEINSRKEKNYLIEIISKKFLVKLRTMYNDNKLYDRLKNIANKNISYDSDTKKIKMIIKEVPIIKPLGKYGYYDTNISRIRNRYVSKIDNIKIEYIIPNPLYELTIITNCYTGSSIGKFHKWDYTNNTACKLCSKTLKELFQEKNKKMDMIYYDTKLQDLNIKFCPDGKLHIFDPKTKKCKLCSRLYDSLIYTNTELKNLVKVLSDKRKKYNSLEEENKNKRDYQYENYIKKLENKKKELNVNDKILKLFIDILSSIIGNEITINNKRINLYHDTYIFMNDQFGNILKEPLILSEKDIIIKDNMIQYKIKNYVVYYSIHHLNLIGYKEGNKDIIKYPIEHNDKFVNIQLSIMNKLKLMGYNSIFLIDVYDYIQKYDYLKENKNKKIVINLLRNRLNRLKNLCNDMYRIIYQIINKFKGIDNNPLLKKYLKIFKNIKTVDADGNIIFKDWKILNESIHIDNNIKNIPSILKDINNEDKYISIQELLNIENNDTKILFYFINQLTILLSLNQDKYTKNQLGYLYCEVINNIFESSFTLLYNNDIQKFKYQLESSHYIDDNTLVYYNTDENFIILTDEEQQQQKELIDIANEEADALDVDIDPEDTNEDFNDEQVQYDGPDIGEGDNNENFVYLGY